MDQLDTNSEHTLTEVAFESRFEEAISLHKKGELAKAHNIYAELFNTHSERLDLMHNLGMVMVGLGELREGANLVKTALAADPNNPGMRGSAKIMGMQLYQHGYWEDAEQWLQQAINISPTDKEAILTLDRIAKRDYLKPERYVKNENQTLIRCSPREAPTYMYIIDIVGTCNLGCPTCPVGNSVDSDRKQTLMSFSNFETILLKIDAEKLTPQIQIHLYNWGEPLLHPDLPKFIALIRQYGFTSHISTNLNIEKGLKELVKASPDDLKISLSGFSQETYGVTHKKGSVLLVKSNMYKLRQYIDQYKKPVHVWVGHHLYKNNFHEKGEVQAICEELRFQYSPIQAFYQPLEKLIAIAEDTIDLTEEPILENLLVHPKKQMNFSKEHQNIHFDCELRFNQTVINADGSVALCCSQYQTENMLGVDFLTTTHNDIEDLKYDHSLCTSCRKHGLDYSPKQIPKSLSEN